LSLIKQENGKKRKKFKQRGPNHMGKALLHLAVISLASIANAQLARTTVYIEPQQGFETYLAAAMTKKHVPVDVVTDAAKANYVIKTTPVETKTESTGSKITRCLFLYCAGIEDKSSASVQLIDAKTTKILWAYSVAKGWGGARNGQSMAEAVAKHLKKYLEEK
jgi:hypothetical protein